MELIQSEENFVEVEPAKNMLLLCSCGKVPGEGEGLGLATRLQCTGVAGVYSL